MKPKTNTKRCENCDRVIRGKSRKVDDMIVCSKCKKGIDSEYEKSLNEEDMYDYQ